MDSTPPRGVPAPASPKAPAGTTLAAMRSRGLAWTGRGVVAVPSTGAMLPARDLTGDEAAAYLGDGDDLRRLVAEGFYRLAPPPPIPPVAPVAVPTPPPVTPATAPEGESSDA